MPLKLMLMAAVFVACSSEKNESKSDLRNSQDATDVGSESDDSISRAEETKASESNKEPNISLSKSATVNASSSYVVPPDDVVEYSKLGLEFEGSIFQLKWGKTKRELATNSDLNDFVNTPEWRTIGSVPGDLYYQVDGDLHYLDMRPFKHTLSGLDSKRSKDDRSWLGSETTTLRAAAVFLRKQTEASSGIPVVQYFKINFEERDIKGTSSAYKSYLIYCQSSANMSGYSHSVKTTAALLRLNEMSDGLCEFKNIGIRKIVFSTPNNFHTLKVISTTGEELTGELLTLTP